MLPRYGSPAKLPYLQKTCGTTLKTLMFLWTLYQLPPLSAISKVLTSTFHQQWSSQQAMIVTTPPISPHPTPAIELLTWSGQRCRELMQGGHLGYAAWMDFSIMFVTFFLHEHVPTDLSSSWIVCMWEGCGKAAHLSYKCLWWWLTRSAGEFLKEQHLVTVLILQYLGYMQLRWLSDGSGVHGNAPEIEGQFEGQFYICI